MRAIPVIFALVLACSSKSDNKQQQPPQPNRDTAQPNLALRSAIEKVGDQLPDLGAFPLPKELGEDPVFVLEDGVYDHDPTGKPVLGFTDRKLPGSDLVVSELLPLFEQRTRGQTVKPFGVDLYVHRDTPFHTFARVLATAREAGFGRFYLGVKTHQGIRRMPMSLPDEGAAPLDVVVSVATDRLRVWSTSGELGTQDSPAVDVPASSYGALASGLDKLVPRDNRAPLTIQIAPDVPYQSVVLVVAALRPIAANVTLGLAAQ